jgi:hypothetical protein
MGDNFQHHQGQYLYGSVYKTTIIKQFSQITAFTARMPQKFCEADQIIPLKQNIPEDFQVIPDRVGYGIRLV